MKIVLKYGGTSVNSLEKISKIASYVKRLVSEKKKIVVVVSAMAGETNALIDLSKQAAARPNPREVDQLISTGENKTAALLALTLNDKGVRAVSLTGGQAGIITDEKFNNAFIEQIKTEKITSMFDKFDAVVVTGFQGVTRGGCVTTFGKGGSDTTAVALAAALGASCQIFTDVAGVHTVDPKIYPQSKKLTEISYDEIMEISAGGAKVMETRSVEIAKKFGVDLWIGAAGETDRAKGTYVMERVQNFEYMPIKNLTVKNDIYMIKIEFSRFEQGIFADFFEILSKYNQKIEMASVTEKSNRLTLSCCISEALIRDIEIELKASDALKNAKISTSKRLTKIMLVGSGFATHTLISKRIFSLLEKNKINVSNVAINELSISFTINPLDKDRAVTLLAQEIEVPSV